jgi:hypothetical protein
VTGECELHDVEFDKCSICPVCEGIHFEQERIIKKLLSSLIEFQYFNGLTSHRIDPNEHTKDEAEAILRNIIKEDQ